MAGISTLGGFSKGVLLGFSQAIKLNDADGFLTHGTNKQVYYKIFHSISEIDVNAIILLLKEAAELDNKFK